MIAPRLLVSNEERDSPGTAAASAALLLSVAELAELLGVCTKTIRRMLKAEKLPRHLEVGRLFKWKRQEILRWIDAGCPDREEWETREKWNPQDAMRGLRGAKSV